MTPYTPVLVDGKKYVSWPAIACTAYHSGQRCAFTGPDFQDACDSVKCGRIVYLSETDFLTHKLLYGTRQS